MLISGHEIEFFQIFNLLRPVETRHILIMCAGGPLKTSKGTAKLAMQDEYKMQTLRSGRVSQLSTLGKGQPGRDLPQVANLP